MTSRQPTISVAIASYNGEKHIREQLDSLSKQTLLPVELVVTDDGSTDATLQEVEAFARIAPFPVKVVRNETRLGYANNFLKAASLCSGDLIAFCDQDDFWLENKLAVCSRYFVENGVSLVVHSGAVWTGKSQTGQRYPDFNRTRILDPGSSDPFALIPGFAMVFRRELLALTDNLDRPNCMFGLGNKSIMAHDSWIWLLATGTGKTATLNTVLALHRHHSTNTVGPPRKWTFARKLKAAVNSLGGYGDMAEVESKSASILYRIANVATAANSVQIKKVAAKLEYRSQLHRHRDTMYRLNSNVVGRVSSFLRILFLGGYLPDDTKIKIGINAAIKDLFFGVTGVYKRFA